jgi:Rrf2 family transcriptional regulator, iron-sulfur cluster assembly transcription factor
MLSLSQSTGYAIQALACLEAEGGRARLIRDVAEESGVPGPYLAKIFKRLAAAGLIVSKRGHKGGTWLRRPPGEISLLEIGTAIDGRAWMGQCVLGLADCSDRRGCPTHEFWKRERVRIEDELRRTSLADVVACGKAAVAAAGRRKR